MVRRQKAGTKEIFRLLLVSDFCRKSKLDRMNSLSNFSSFRLLGWSLDAWHLALGNEGRGMLGCPWVEEVWCWCGWVSLYIKACSHRPLVTFSNCSSLKGTMSNKPRRERERGCVCVPAHTTVWIWRSEVNSWESALSPIMSLRDQTQLISLDSLIVLSIKPSHKPFFFF